MKEITVERVLEALKGVQDPELKKDMLELGMIQDVAVDGDEVSLRLILTTPACPLKNAMRENVEKAIKSKLPEVKKVNIKMDAQVAHHGKAIELLPDVKNVIIVASGKGGVGKSTVAVNLASAMAQHGAKVGLLDADIYGPSIPIMLGTAAKPEVEGEKILPIEAFGMKVMSIGFLIDPSKAVIWRGPMVSSALTQLMSEVVWGELDYLFMDLPPGTGDVQLTIAQNVRPSGAILVTTPQLVAVSEVVRSLSMFDKVEIPILGIIENMSYFKCPDCGSKHAIFGTGGGKELAEKYNLPFLGEIPIDTTLRTSGDEGAPFASLQAGTEIGKAFHAAAEQLAAQISQLK